MSAALNTAASAREALIAEVLGEVDDLVRRIEALAPAIATAQAGVAHSSASLERAADTYRRAVEALTQQGQVQLGGFIQRKTTELALQAAEQQRALLADTARAVLAPLLEQQVPRLVASVHRAAREFRRAAWTRLFEHAMTAVIASGITATLILLVLR